METGAWQATVHGVIKESNLATKQQKQLQHNTVALVESKDDHGLLEV